MTMGVVSDGLMAGCHVVGKIPALGVAICLGLVSYAGIVPVNMHNDSQVQNECAIGDDHFLIDIEGVRKDVSFGECLEEYDPITLAELRERCLRPEARNEEICVRI